MARASRRSAHTTVATSPDVRRAVLDGALAIIASDGADSVSMRDVARRAGVSHQAPYHYFGDRAGIFAAICEEGFTQFADEFEATLNSTSDPVRDCLRTYVMFATNNVGHYRVMFRSDISGASTHEHSRRAADRAFAVLLDLAERISPGNGTSENPLMLPITLWSMAHGLSTLLMDGPLIAKIPDDMPIDTLISQFTDFATRSLDVQFNR
jgi:AcrR family transcriptional regulator